jgi:hypothetical protein
MVICTWDLPLNSWLKNTAGLILDPMAGGGVTPDTCLAMGRSCRAFDMMDRPDTRPEIEPFTWGISSDQQFSWPVSAKEKPDLIIFDGLFQGVAERFIQRFHERFIAFFVRFQL